MCESAEEEKRTIPRAGWILPQFLPTQPHNGTMEKRCQPENMEIHISRGRRHPPPVTRTVLYCRGEPPLSHHDNPPNQRTNHFWDDTGQEDTAPHSRYSGNIGIPKMNPSTGKYKGDLISCLSHFLPSYACSHQHCLLLCYYPASTFSTKLPLNGYSLLHDEDGAPFRTSLQPAFTLLCRLHFLTTT